MICTLKNLLLHGLAVIKRFLGWQKRQLPWTTSLLRSCSSYVYVLCCLCHIQCVWSVMVAEAAQSRAPVTTQHRTEQNRWSDLDFNLRRQWIANKYDNRGNQAGGNTVILVPACIDVCEMLCWSDMEFVLDLARLNLNAFLSAFKIWLLVVLKIFL